MVEGRIETKCSTCSHLKVCAFKKQYINLVSKMQESFYEATDEDKRNVFSFRDPACSFYAVNYNIGTMRTVKEEGDDHGISL